MDGASRDGIRVSGLCTVCCDSSSMLSHAVLYIVRVKQKSHILFVIGAEELFLISSNQVKM